MGPRFEEPGRQSLLFFNGNVTMRFDFLKLCCEQVVVPVEQRKSLRFPKPRRRSHDESAQFMVKLLDVTLGGDAPMLFARKTPLVVSCRVAADGLANDCAGDEAFLSRLRSASYSNRRTR